MKFKNYFIDEHGNIWTAKSLIEKSKDLSTFQFHVEAVSLDTIVRWKLITLRDYYNQFRRITNADLTVPIVLRDDGYIMLGWHRLIKAINHGTLYLPARQFTITPEPDFKIE
jgi:hypothetical protein